MANLFVLGSGGFGTALAVMLSGAGHSVRLWGWQDWFQEELRKNRENTELLKGVKIPDEVGIVDDIDGIEEAEVVFFATPTVGIRTTAKMCAGRLKEGAVLCCVAKGLEPGSLLRLDEVIGEELPGHPVVALSGPSHAEELTRGVPTAVVAASADQKAAQRVQDLTANTHVRIYTSDDVIGVELGGALKNIIAFAAGIIDGMGFGDNTKAALMTRGITEIARLGVAMGARPETFMGLSGVGDLIVTCCSMHSRNRRCGIYVGEGLSVAEAVEKVGMTVEGIVATECAYELSQKAGVEMPITTQGYLLIKGQTTVKQVVSALLERPLKHETEANWLKMERSGD